MQTRQDNALVLLLMVGLPKCVCIPGTSVGKSADNQPIQGMMIGTLYSC